MFHVDIGPEVHVFREMGNSPHWVIGNTKCTTSALFLWRSSTTRPEEFSDLPVTLELYGEIFQRAQMIKTITNKKSTPASVTPTYKAVVWIWKKAPQAFCFQEVQFNFENTGHRYFTSHQGNADLSMLLSCQGFLWKSLWRFVRKIPFFFSYSCWWKDFITCNYKEFITTMFHSDSNQISNI